MSVISRLRDAGFEAYTRDQWGTARESSYETRKRTHAMPAGPASFHYLHITVTADTDAMADGFQGARNVESYGLSTPPMVSYQMLTTNEGRAFEGQNYGTKGTHTINDKSVSGFPNDLNYYGYACALMQNVDDEVTDVQVRLIAAVFAAVELEGHVVRGAPIYPHRDFAWKSCPGDKAVARLDEIKRLKQQYVTDGLGGAPTEEDEMAAEDVSRIIERVNAVTREEGDRTRQGLSALRKAESSRAKGDAERDRAILEQLAGMDGDLDQLAATSPKMKASFDRLRQRVNAATRAVREGATPSQ